MKHSFAVVWPASYNGVLHTGSIVLGSFADLPATVCAYTMNWYGRLLVWTCGMLALAPHQVRMHCPWSACHTLLPHGWPLTTGLRSRLCRLGAPQFMAEQRDLLPLVHTLLYLEEALDVRK